MRLRRFIRTFCLALAVLLIPLGARAGIDLTEKEIKTLSAGGLVMRPLPGSGKNSMIAGVSFALINAPREVVWRAFRDLSAWPVIFYNTHEARQLGAADRKSTVQVKVGNRYISFDFFLTLLSDKEKWSFSYAIDKTKPHEIEDTRGKLQLVEQPGGRTLVIFSTYVKVPFGLLIKIMGDEVLEWIEHRLLSVPTRLKEWVEDPTGDKYRADAGIKSDPPIEAKPDPKSK
jgi:hypothetical protein